MKRIFSFILINLGILLVSIGVAVFKVPNHFATGGVSGIAIIIHEIVPFLPIGFLMLIINIILLTIGLRFAGIEFEIKTIYSTIVIALLTWFFEKVFPVKTPLTGDTMLELCFAILLIAGGTAILFYQNASSGGTDIIAKILNLTFHWHIGQAVLVVDFIVSLFAVFIFGFKIGMYSVLGVVAKGFIIDAVIKGLHSSKQIIIISSKAEEIKNFIMNNLKRGVTVYNAKGGYTNEEKQVLNTVMGNREAIKLRKYIMQIDKTAFVVVDNVTDIHGKGFTTLGL